jgi:hypothetical protein
VHELISARLKIEKQKKQSAAADDETHTIMREDFSSDCFGVSSRSQPKAVRRCHRDHHDRMKLA